MSHISPQKLRWACASLLTLCVATASFANSPPVVSDAAMLTAFFERGDARLEGVTSAEVDAAARLVSVAQVTAWLERDARKLSGAIDQRIDAQLTALTNEGVARRLARRDTSGSQEPRRVVKMRIESGSIPLLEGIQGGSLLFEEPFGRPPDIALGIRVHETPVSNRAPVALRIIRVDERGFDYEVQSRGSDGNQALSARWVAYAGKSNPAEPAR